MKVLLAISVLLLIATVQPLQAGQTGLGTLNTELSLARQEPTPGATGAGTSAEKSPATACILSLVIPGLGQHYNGQHVKGVIQEALFVGGAAMVVASVGSVLGDWSGGGWEQTAGTIGLVICGGSYLWSVIDAPISANRINTQSR